jgi:hypothetical protein
MTLRSSADFERLFETFQTSAWRLECQGVYNEPEEAEPLRRFFAGEPDDLSWYADWTDWVRDVRTSGRTIGRAHTLTNPLSDYLRFELDRPTPPAIAAGEDIRVIKPEDFEALALPNTDFWIFDDSTVGVLHFDDTGVGGVETITDASKVTEFIQRKRRALAVSVPYREWATGTA